MDTPHAPSELVFRRSGWIPRVIRRDGLLRLELGAGADANHEPRTFSFLVNETHLAVIKEDLTRHLLLWFAVLPLCEAAGTRDPFSDEAAMALLDPILLGSEPEVETMFRENGWDTRGLVGHNADIDLLEKGQLFAALRNATETSDRKRVEEYNANKDRAKRGVILSELDAALLKYTGQYIYRSGIPGRKPDAVDPALLPQVTDVIKTAEKASAGMEFPSSYASDPKLQIDKQRWNEISDAVTQALADAHPSLANDVVRSIGHLMCSEAVSRARHPK